MRRIQMSLVHYDQLTLQYHIIIIIIILKWVLLVRSSYIFLTLLPLSTK